MDLVPIDGELNRVHLALKSVSDDGRPDLSQLLVKVHKQLVIPNHRIHLRVCKLDFPIAREKVNLACESPHPLKPIHP